MHLIQIEANWINCNLNPNNLNYDLIVHRRTVAVCSNSAMQLHYSAAIANDLIPRQVNNNPYEANLK
jgi:hypothetical protein